MHNSTTADPHDTAAATTLHCATLIVLALSFMSAGMGAAFGDGWQRDAGIGSGALMAVWAAWLGIGEIRRLLRRSRLRSDHRPMLSDRARYVAGLPGWPRAQRMAVMLTEDALLLDDDHRTVRLPLTGFRQALAPDPESGRPRPWLVARNEYGSGANDSGSLVVDVLQGDAPRRIVLTAFRKTTAEDWRAAIDSGCRAIREAHALTTSGARLVQST